MRTFFLFYIKIFVIFSQIKNENSNLTEGYYEISSHLNNLYLSVNKKKIIISKIKSTFFIIPITKFSYIIKFRNHHLGIDHNNEIILYNNIKNIEINKYSWYIYNIKKNLYFIKNKFNNKLIEISDDNYIKISNDIKYNNDKKIIFSFFKLLDSEPIQNKKYLKKII